MDLVVNEDNMNSFLSSNKQASLSRLGFHINVTMVVTPASHPITHPELTPELYSINT